VVVALDKKENLMRIVECGVVSIIRVRSSEEAVKISDAIKKGGVNVIEVSLVTPGALEAIRTISGKLDSEVLLGAGTVLDPESARAAILAGSEFIVGPNLRRSMIEMCRRYSVISVPGTLTPTEILTAWEWGADLVKVFPASLGGPAYIKSILDPLPQVRLLPTGGVDLTNAGDFIKAGASAVAVGGTLVDKKAVASGNFEVITENARKFMDVVKKARAK
jgi:2-dehydro-3-deoxyphosphogluconate aldolase/(4S)-4-hydroxy-2-oxoglutarate aldolase